MGCPKSFNERHFNQKLCGGTGLGQFVCKTALYLFICAQNVEDLTSKKFCKIYKQ